MKFIKVNKNVKNSQGEVWKAGEIRLVMMDIDPQNWNEIINPDDLLKIYNYKKDTNVKNILLILGGGIGDIIAYSAVLKFLKDKNVYFATQPQYFPVLEWYEVKPYKIIDIKAALFTDYTFQNKFKYEKWRRIKSEFVVVMNNKIDWMDVIFGYLGVTEIDRKMLRPQLTRKIIIKSNIDKNKKSLLICNQSSCMMRNIEFDEIYDCLPEKVKEEYKLYAYDNALSQDDTDKMFEGKYNDVKFIYAKDTGEFLKDLYDATEVITVDSAATHFREGVNKRCLTLYNSFRAEYRMRYYKYGTGANFTSTCEHQPCFQHELIKGEFCKNVKKWQYSAPCFRSETNLNLKNELKFTFEKYFNAKK